ncbi:DUF11 domain-containing protein [Natrinema longum]|uniref:DUF11 domain-containing protein n=1 Tax=Natrinema longum TaxID=370324 RepID=A0A8A2U8W4_9EURY|nr:DUF11 domain-containing protein [Natrinema longum]MBZ6493540.1 DUF11 domain-containing protein [Natrinema longum]QSW85114.1 DUF11 domain-containing protein [Natrinema longum]
MTDEGSISRRRILRAMSVGSGVAVAGCLGGGGGGSCTDLSLDLRTGTTNGTPDTFGTTDSEWRVVSSPDGTTGQAVSVEPVDPWVTLPTANWIDPYGTGGWPTTTDPLGDYVYEIDFEVPEDWSDEQCELRIHQWSVDDDATIELEGPSGTVTLAQDSGHATLKGPVTQPVSPGQYTLRAEVANAMTVTGLLIDAELVCTCDDEPSDEACDLSIAKEHVGDGSPVAVGETTEFEITVCNDGDGTCRPGPVTVVDDLPNGLSSVTHTGSGWNCTESGGVVTCEHPNTNGLGPGDCLPTLTLAVDVVGGDDMDDRIVNCATVKQGDASASNKSDCATVPIVSDGTGDGACDLAITKTHDGTHVTPGDTTTFEISVCNDSEHRCRGSVSVVDPLPNGVSFVSGSGSGWTTADNNGVVTATHQNSASLAPGDCLPTLSLEVEIGSMDETGDAIVNCASIDGDDADPDTNRSCTTVPVRPASDGCDGLEIEKRTGDQFRYGQQATYEIDVCNTSKRHCDGRITVTDDLPGGISFVSASGSGWSASVAGGTVTAVHSNATGLGPSDCLPTLTLTVDVAPAAQFPGGSDGIRNCARLFTDGTVVDEGCVSHVITNE